MHAGSPPLNAYLLPLRLRPITFAATSSVFFAAVNLAKWLPYAWLGLIDRANMATSVLLLPLAPLGVWLGVWLARRIEPRWFYAVAYAGMFFTGAKLLWDGLALRAGTDWCARGCRSWPVWGGRGTAPTPRRHRYC